ncbi:MAG: patatin-like phospholipase family protein [Christensenellaceae bacterium]|jgi:NTE family protein|nr:patatin-like phospholipase family protein [Christensenellaceae bacterium]
MGFFSFFKLRAKKQAVDDAAIHKHQKAKLGLVLGGGATRGFAHIGVIKAFEEWGIDVDFIAATSAGSIVGALYAAGLGYEEIYARAKTLRKKDIVSKKLFLLPSKTTGLENVMKDTIGDLSFSELKKPLAVVAVDLVSGEEVVITKGKVCKAVAGSCSVPGFFVPTEFEEMHLADGSLQNNIPADVARSFGCNYVIAVDVNSTRGSGTESLKMTDVLSSALGILMKSNSVKGYMHSDIMLQPNMKRFSSQKIEGLEDMIEEGYSAAIERMDEIEALISGKPKAKNQKEKSFSSIYKARII